MRIGRISQARSATSKLCSTNVETAAAKGSQEVARYNPRATMGGLL